MKSKVPRNIHYQARIEKLQRRIDQLEEENRRMLDEVLRRDHEIERLLYKDAFEVIDAYDDAKELSKKERKDIFEVRNEKTKH